MRAPTRERDRHGVLERAAAADLGCRRPRLRLVLTAPRATRRVREAYARVQGRRACSASGTGSSSTRSIPWCARIRPTPGPMASSARALPPRRSSRGDAGVRVRRRATTWTSRPRRPRSPPRSAPPRLPLTRLRGRGRDDRRPPRRAGPGRRGGRGARAARRWRACRERQAPAIPARRLDAARQGAASRWRSARGSGSCAATLETSTSAAPRAGARRRRRSPPRSSRRRSCAMLGAASSRSGRTPSPTSVPSSRCTQASSRRRRALRREPAA